MSLIATGLSIGYDKTIVIEDFDLEVPDGQICALVGENGAGKSTLLKGLAGFMPMTYDSLKIDGRDTTTSSRFHRNSTFSILDNFAWIRGLTLWDHYRALAHGSSNSDIEEAMDTFDVYELADRMPYSLSTGQLQRASLVTILLREWRVLFLDEPEQRLDVTSQEILADVLREVAKDRSVIMASHSPTLVDRSGAHVVAIGA
ncbi:MAG: ATP-binding cassette domain-containing protein [Actinomycetaceae bacterium]|nr:ATP-binding cassette domain-containing protein [Actinomycetaceae bacterium]